MINGYLDEFEFFVEYGLEINFIYEGQKYFLIGYEDEGTKNLYLSRTDPYEESYIWIGYGTVDEYPKNKFFSEPIIYGKKFMEIEPYMEWLDA